MPPVRKKRKRRKKSRYHRGIHVSPKAGSCSYRSGWELSYMKWLDDNAAVTAYEYEKLVIEYVSNMKSKKIRRYFPDFLVHYADGHRELIEIKPKKRLVQATVKKKAAAAEAWCAANNMKYTILTEVELKSLSIIS